MYNDGRGVPQDYAAALREWRPLAEAGNASAQNNLGFMYLNGRGVPRDYVQAHIWFNLAAGQGGIIDAVKNRDVAASLMTPADISKAQRLAKEWLEKHPQ